mmetsp:Transcript_108623/g.346794  ORF Transcript_108623/g.346794 Transcript_108623/m.346794 type:complete len:230 (+) Transcript_108623:61-750(+)
MSGTPSELGGGPSEALYRLKNKVVTTSETSQLVTVAEKRRLRSAYEPWLRPPLRAALKPSPIVQNPEIANTHLILIVCHRSSVCRDATQCRMPRLRREAAPDTAAEQGATQLLLPTDAAGTRSSCHGGRCLRSRARPRSRWPWNRRSVPKGAFLGRNSAAARPHPGPAPPEAAAPARQPKSPRRAPAGGSSRHRPRRRGRTRNRRWLSSPHSQRWRSPNLRLHNSASCG